MEQRITQLGGLRARVIDSEEKASLLVVLCHGYGAPGDDLVPLGNELRKEAPKLARQVRFVFPEAPLDLAAQGHPTGRAWWHLDLERLVSRAQQVDPEEDTQLPDGVPAARRKLMALVDEAARAAGLPLSRVVLAGFSQGAMIATEVALRLEEAPAALGIFSGTLVSAAGWHLRASARQGLRVFQTHGRSDGLLPFHRAEALRVVLAEAGLQVEFLPFEGGHTIAPKALRRFAEVLSALV